MPNAPHLSLVIPAFNEAHRLPESLRAIALFCGKFSFPWEVLVVVERSTDETLDLAFAAAAEQANFHVIDNKVQRGKGYAVRTGMLRATGAICFYMDADLSVPLKEIRKFLERFQDRSVDVLIANRQHKHSRILRRQGFVRRFMGHCFNRILRRIAGVDIFDTQCGFKAFRREAARAIFSRQKLDGFAFDVEVLLLAKKLHLDVVDLPVEWVNSSESRLHLFRDSFKMFSDAARVRSLVEETMRQTPAPIITRKA
jgi:dolichyl-phosphate beta-glucosyltransferase